MFLHFDRERSNSLNNGEFGAALASLGLNYEAEEMEEVFSQISGGKEYVGFEQFIRFMVMLSACTINFRWNYMKIRLLLNKYD